MLIDEFLRFDDELARVASQPKCSDFWRGEVQRYLTAYEAGSLEWWACIGRGGAKSTTIYKLALFFTLHVDFEIPRAETHFAIVLSRNKTEAAKGLVIVARWLQALGVEHDATGEVIRIDPIRRGIRVLSASVGGASGWRAFAVFADEYAKWAREGEALMLDADEVLASAKATTATHARAPAIVMSTPWTKSGSFFETITSPPTGVVVSGPTPSWVANPSAITEAATHAKERNPSKWAREYNAEFTESFEGGFYDEAAIVAAIDYTRDGITIRPDTSMGHVVTIDPAFAHDAFTCSVAHAEGPRIVVDLCIGWSPKLGELDPTQIIDKIIAIRHKYPGPNTVYSDQREFFSLRDLFRARGVALADAAWQWQSKIEKYTLVQRLLADRLVSLPNNAMLLREFRGIGMKRNPSGTETISYRGSDDYASSAVMAICKAYEMGTFLGPNAPRPEWVGSRRFN